MKLDMITEGNNMKRILVSGLFVLIACVGCGNPDGPDQSTVDRGDGGGGCSILGKWKDSVLDGFFTYSADGTILFEFAAYDVMGTGTFTFENQTDLTWSTDRPDCPGNKAHYRIEFQPNCQEFTFIEEVLEECSNRIGLVGQAFRLVP